VTGSHDQTNIDIKMCETKQLPDSVQHCLPPN